MYQALSILARMARLLPCVQPNQSYASIFSGRRSVAVDESGEVPDPVRVHLPLEGRRNRRPHPETRSQEGQNRVAGGQPLQDHESGILSITHGNFCKF